MSSLAGSLGKIGIMQYDRALATRHRNGVNMTEKWSLVVSFGDEGGKHMIVDSPPVAGGYLHARGKRCVCSSGDTFDASATFDSGVDIKFMPHIGSVLMKR